MSHARLGELLLSEKAIDARGLAFAIAVQAAAGNRQKLGQVLIEQGLVGKEFLARSLAIQAGWEFYNGPYIPDPGTIEAVGLTFIKEYSAYPLISGIAPVFVLPDADDPRVSDRLTLLFGNKIVFYIGVETDLQHAIACLERGLQDGAADPLTDIRSLLSEATLKGATDIHIEPAGTTVNVRFRIDGVLHFFRAYPRAELPRFVNMAFNRAGISAGDFLRFHDARFDEECAGRRIDVRLSHIPSVNGSSLVLRILDKSRSAVPLGDLGYSQRLQAQLLEALKRPHGLILFTGPTGCGKTTSLYSLLSGLKGLDVKVVTAEDPVEVSLPLVIQVPVDLRRDQDFHHITRALLRHDPDIILVGEIRDEQTAREAMRAALTGHRVLATLHTNDAMGAVLRLQDLGIDYAQLSHGLTCIVAQRLVRKLCPQCRVAGGTSGEYTASKNGCSSCLGGFNGRTVAAEVMTINDEMRLMIEQGLIRELEGRYLMAAGRQSMRDDAGRLVMEGVISRAELERVMG